MIDKSLLKVAITPDTHFLLQAELKAINQGLEYTEKEGKYDTKYKGYVNKDGQREGVGISSYGDRDLKIRGEWHKD
jgi:hypothetical protein